MSPLEALILGIIQGLTEFLPVSSSGHLVLGKKLLNVTAEMPVTFEVVVHAGTLLATLIVFRRTIQEILVFLAGAFSPRDSEAVGVVYTPAWRRWWDDPAGRLLILVLIGTIPAGLVGVLLEDRIEALFSSALLVGVALLVTGLVLFATRWVGREGRTMDRLTLGQGVLVGIAQAAAITPGISRSGSTIATGLLMGMERETAARFSFILSMPAIAGATLLKARDIFHAGEAIGFPPLVLGFASALVIGWLALVLLIGIVRRGKLHWFSWYCWLAGAVAIAAWSMGYLR